MFHREGQKIILFTFFIIAVLVFLADRYVSADWVRITVQIIAILILVSILQFFRNPRRVSNKNFNEIHAPVDGKVVVIERVMETEYFKEERLQVSIFMSPVNVHVTRYPASGVIKYSKYHPGKYLVAWHPKSSEENERTTVVIRTPKFGDILYRQIAGAMARRIVNYAEEGESVQQGEESGFIKFGSRVDVFLPLNAMVAVKLNQKVKGAVTCLASLNTYDEEG